jgi:hypothetical protein
LPKLITCDITTLQHTGSLKHIKQSWRLIVLQKVKGKTRVYAPLNYAYNQPTVSTGELPIISYSHGTDSFDGRELKRKQVLPECMYSFINDFGLFLNCVAGLTGKRQVTVCLDTKQQGLS